SPTGRFGYQIQLLPMSQVVYAPPSVPISKWFALFGSHQIACLSSCSEVSIGLNVRAPSSERYSRTLATSTWSGFEGSIRTWLKYTGRLSGSADFLQVAPPSSLR